MENLKLAPLISESNLQKKIIEMAKKIEDDFKGQDLVVVCVLKGSFMFFSDLVRSINLDIRCEFFGLSSYGNSTKSSGQVKMTLDIDSSLEGKNVLIVEDIVDTGLTMKYLVNSISLRKPKTIRTATLLFKPEAIKEDCQLDYIGFEVGNQFVVGYGLDYQGYYRNIPYVAVVQNMN